MINLGQKIIELRRKNGLSASELARRAGVTRGFVSLVENNRSGMSADKLRIFAELLGVEPSELRPEESSVQVNRPDWLKYLIENFALSVDDERELRKLSDKIALAEYIPGETPKEFKARWKSFYEQMLPYLPSASVRILKDARVCQALELLGVSGENACWRDVLHTFEAVVEKKIGICNVDDGCVWRNRVSRALSITTPDRACVGAGKALAISVAAIQSQIQSSHRIYGAVVKDEENNGYLFFPGKPNAYFDRREFAWWHEAVRVLIDPALTLGLGVYYYPDGEDIPPLAFFMRRLASWLAYLPFKAQWLSQSKSVMPQRLQTFVNSTYHGSLPWRESFIALLDFIDSPLAYLDCYPRMKRAELKDNGIQPENLKEMCVNPKAALRIGYVFRNIAAEETHFEIRNNLRVPETSPIMTLFRSKKESESSESEELSNWDKSYDLMGEVLEHCVRQNGSSGERHVRVVMEVK